MRKAPNNPIHGYGWRGPYWIQEGWHCTGPVRWWTICRYLEAEMRRWFSADKSWDWIEKTLRGREFHGFEIDDVVGRHQI